jgi:hypothetical protein
MAIKLITFKTNHTVLATVLDEGDIGVIIKEPVQVVSIPPSASNQEGGIAFSPFLEYSEEFKTGIVIKNSDILTINSPIVDLENQYNRIFGSGIQIASSIS